VSEEKGGEKSWKTTKETIRKSSPTKVLRRKRLAMTGKILFQKTVIKYIVKRIVSCKWESRMKRKLYYKTLLFITRRTKQCINSFMIYIKSVMNGALLNKWRKN